MKNKPDMKQDKKLDTQSDMKTKDSEAHYDIDGVSLSKNDDVVVSGDNLTTQGAPLPQNIFPQGKNKKSEAAKVPARS